MAKIIRVGAVAIIALCVFALIFVGKQANAAPSSATNSTSVNSSVTALPNYDVSVFAKGNTKYFNPDSVVVTDQYVFIGYQNITAKDGTDTKTSTIVEYTKAGKVVRTFSAIGHNDGLRYNSSTHLLWVTSNEDANPRIVTIDPKTGATTSYQFAKTAHGGGYDDVFFLNGIAFIVASNPTLNSAGVNTAPALDKIELKNGQAIVTPVLLGNAMATDLITKQPVTLNLTDPDSLSVDNQGDLVLVGQADMQLVIIAHAGMANQTVSTLPVGTQLDDTVWIPKHEGSLLVVDGKTNTIYKVTIDKTDFTKGTIYTEAPSDSGVAGFVGTVDSATGIITPVIIGLGSPTGMAFFPIE